MVACEVLELTPCHTAVIRETVPMDQLSTFFGQAYPAVLAILAGEGTHPCGPPFAWYSGPPTDEVELEAGFPVEEAIAASGAVVPSRLPGGKVVKAVHIGPYDTLAATYDEMRTWMIDQGMIPTASMWEVYLSDPGSEPPEAWRTEVYWPVA